MPNNLRRRRHRSRAPDTLLELPTLPSPDFDASGAWMVGAYHVGRRFSENICLRVLIDCARQAFLTLELTEGEPGSRIGDWLNAAMPNPSPAIGRLYTDTTPDLRDQEPIARDALLDWGRVHGVDVVIEPACGWRAGMMGAVVQVLLTLEPYFRLQRGYCPPDPARFRQGLQTWQERYNQRVPNRAWVLYGGAEAGGPRPVQMTD
jgi:hypothetical protein